jgi:hypothetical protein
MKKEVYKLADSFAAHVAKGYMNVFFFLDDAYNCLYQYSRKGIEHIEKRGTNYNSQILR